MTRLRKVDVELLLATYDTDPLGALTAALRTVFDQPGTSWAELLGLAGFPTLRQAALLAEDPTALDELAAELNELRSVSHGC